MHLQNSTYWGIRHHQYRPRKMIYFYKEPTDIRVEQICKRECFRIEASVELHWRSKEYSTQHQKLVSDPINYKCGYGDGIKPQHIPVAQTRTQNPKPRLWCYRSWITCSETNPFENSKSKIQNPDPDLKPKSKIQIHAISRYPGPQPATPGRSKLMHRPHFHFHPPVRSDSDANPSPSCLEHSLGCWPWWYPWAARL